MIEAFSLKTAHYFGDVLASQAQLRYRVFVQHRGLHHTHYDCMEYDEFDTPAAVYLVWRDHLLAWSPSGYRARRPRPTHETVKVLTPPSTVAAIHAGYIPEVHVTATG